MPDLPLHQKLGFGFLKVGIQILMHFIFYFWLQLLTHMRHHIEMLCYNLGNTCHWREHSTGRIIVWPWYYKLVNYPAIWIWHTLNFLMKACEWLHSHLVDQDIFMLPEVTYFPLEMDTNLN